MPPSERRKKITIQAGQICPLCREKVHREEVLAVCPGCQAVYHRDCSGELASGRCTTLGCRYSQRRTASGRRPTAPAREERTPRGPRLPLTQPERILRGAMGIGVTIAFLFLAVHVANKIEDNVTKRRVADRRAARVRHGESVLAAYRDRQALLSELAGRGVPPTWRFPKQRFELGNDASWAKPDTVVLSWRQLRNPARTSALDAQFPSAYRHGLYLSSLPPQHIDLPDPASLDPRISHAVTARYVIAVKVRSLRPAEQVWVRDGLVQPSWSKKPYAQEEGAVAGAWPTGAPPHAQAEVVVRAYLYDLESSPSFKGCLEVSGRSPEGFTARVAPATQAGYQRYGFQAPPDYQPYLAELQAAGLEPGKLPRADGAALRAAYEWLRAELTFEEK